MGYMALSLMLRDAECLLLSNARIFHSQSSDTSLKSVGEQERTHREPVNREPENTHTV